MWSQASGGRRDTAARIDSLSEVVLRSEFPEFCFLHMVRDSHEGESGSRETGRRARAVGTAARARTPDNQVFQHGDPCPLSPGVRGVAS